MLKEPAMRSEFYVNPISDKVSAVILWGLAIAGVMIAGLCLILG